MLPTIIAGPFDFNSTSFRKLALPSKKGFTLKKNRNILRNGLYFELVDLLTPKETGIDEKDFYQRTQDNELLAGQLNLLAILQKPELLAKAWEDTFLLGARTVWQMNKQLQMVPYLRCDNPERIWQMDFIWINGLTPRFKLLSLHSEE